VKKLRDPAQERFTAVAFCCALLAPGSKDYGARTSANGDGLVLCRDRVTAATVSALPILNIERSAQTIEQNHLRGIYFAPRDFFREKFCAADRGFS
jgi:hypothetical protein